MVAPEREKPLNGKHRPCTVPIHTASLSSIAGRRLADGSRSPERMIMTPTVASAAAINVRLPNSCSTSALTAPRKMTCSMSIISPKPTTPVHAVATAKLRANDQKARVDEKYRLRQGLQKKEMT